mmetsp:Transcript_23680/g.80084  ORF Transcript_23680/g.80084 Transcript_23680/m.80084 type:complete len:256 (-) Transcript_23680:767-1534(-)
MASSAGPPILPLLKRRVPTSTCALPAKEKRSRRRPLNMAEREVQTPLHRMQVPPLAICPLNGALLRSALATAFASVLSTVVCAVRWARPVYARRITGGPSITHRMMIMASSSCKTSPASRSFRPTKIAIMSSKYLTRVCSILSLNFGHPCTTSRTSLAPTRAGEETSTVRATMRNALVKIMSMVISWAMPIGTARVSTRTWARRPKMPGIVSTPIRARLRSRVSVTPCWALTSVMNSAMPTCGDTLAVATSPLLS